MSCDRSPAAMRRITSRAYSGSPPSWRQTLPMTKYEPDAQADDHQQRAGQRGVQAVGDAALRTTEAGVEVRTGAVAHGLQVGFKGLLRALHRGDGRGLVARLGAQEHLRGVVGGREIRLEQLAQVVADVGLSRDRLDAGDGLAHHGRLVGGFFQALLVAFGDGTLDRRAERFELRRELGRGVQVRVVDRAQLLDGLGRAGREGEHGGDAHREDEDGQQRQHPDSVLDTHDTLSSCGARAPRHYSRPARRTRRAAIVISQR